MNGPFQILSQSLKHLDEPMRDMMKQNLAVKMLIAMILGVLIGLILSPSTGWITPNRAGLPPTVHL